MGNLACGLMRGAPYGKDKCLSIINHHIVAYPVGVTSMFFNEEMLHNKSGSSFVLSI
jgi:hypothetical protein